MYCSLHMILCTANLGYVSVVSQLERKVLRVSDIKLSCVSAQEQFMYKPIENAREPLASQTKD